MTPPPSERSIVGLVAVVQFVNILDFMMVMPLGPDFAEGLNLDPSHLGYIGGSYTAAAAVSGLIGSFFLDRWPRRVALPWALVGLAMGTALGAAAVGMGSLIVARLVAGFFGGPATSLALSVIADAVPEERRGRAMGVVMGAFAAASVLGVPAGLELSTLGGWRMPFLAVAAVTLLVAAVSRRVLPDIARPAMPPGKRRWSDLIHSRVVTAYLMMGLMMGATFLVVPNISSFIQFNLGYPRDRVGVLYLLGGALSFFTMRIAGRGVDRFGARWIGLFGVASLTAILEFGYARPVLPVSVLFCGFMAASSFRAVAANTLATRVPRPHERAQYMSLQSAVQHLASSGGAFISARMLTADESNNLIGMPQLVHVSMAVGVLFAVALWALDKTLGKAQTAPPTAFA